jgi:hypothetical protein
MSKFELYLKLGTEHILDINGLDHLIFMLAIASVFSIVNWKKLLIMVTAFTLGHSLTLILAALHVVSVNMELVETLIPITILLTSLVNLWKKGRERHTIVLYILMVLFGLIHGLGFSNYFGELVAGDQDLILALFSFNLGIEVAQILVVLSILIIHIIFDKIFSVKRESWILFMNGGVFFLALSMIIG